MKLLAFEFSSAERSIALFDVSDGVAHIMQYVTSQGNVRSWSHLLQPPIWENFDPAAIEAIAVGLGPGSYTGIRSSLAIAQGWNLARNIPAAGVSSAEAIAFAAFAKGLRGAAEVVIDAQRAEVYSALYNLTDFSLLRPLKILSRPETTTLIGSEAKRWSEEGIVIEPSAAIIGKLASREKNFGPPERLEAIYLREPSFVKAPAVRHA